MDEEEYDVQCREMSLLGFSLLYFFYFPCYVPRGYRVDYAILSQSCNRMIQIDADIGSPKDLCEQMKMQCEYGFLSWPVHVLAEAVDAVKFFQTFRLPYSLEEQLQKIGPENWLLDL